MIAQGSSTAVSEHSFCSRRGKVTTAQRHLFVPRRGVSGAQRVHITWLFPGSSNLEKGLCGSNHFPNFS